MSGGRIITKFFNAYLCPQDGCTKQLKGTLFLVQQLKDLSLEWTLDADFSAEKNGWSFVDSYGEPEVVSVNLVGKLRKYNFCFPIRHIKSICHTKDSDKDTGTLKFILNDGDTYMCLFYGKKSAYSNLVELSKYINVERSRNNDNIFIVKGPNEETISSRLDDITQRVHNPSLRLLDRFATDPVKAAVQGLAKLTNNVRSVGADVAHALANQASSGHSPAVFHPEHFDDLAQSVAMSQLLESSQNSTSSVENFDEVPMQGPTVGVFVEPFEHDGLAEDDGFAVVTKLPAPPVIKREPPLSRSEWEASLNADGRVQSPDDIRMRIFRGGVSGDLRREVWPFLLGFYSWDSTSNSRRELLTQKVEEYYCMKTQWKTFSDVQERQFMAWRERKQLIEKDVCRTDKMHPFFIGADNRSSYVMADILSTYVMYNFDLGYVQGMSDLLAPVMIVMGANNEAETFWCFAAMLDKISRNFEMSQDFMKQQLQRVVKLLRIVDCDFYDYLDGKDALNLYFCFQWLLILFKREFNLDNDVMTVWEALFSGYPCANYALLICLALIGQERGAIMENEFGFNEILKHMNSMSMQTDVDRILVRAEAIYWQLSNYSSLPNEIRAIIYEENVYKPAVRQKTKGAESASHTNANEMLDVADAHHSLQHSPESALMRSTVVCL